MDQEKDFSLTFKDTHCFIVISVLSEIVVISFSVLPNSPKSICL